jgi:hypothetical protein
MRLVRAIVLLLAAASFSGAVQAQGMADAAQREKERRARQKEKSKAPAKSYGNEDLPTTGRLANEPGRPPADSAKAGDATTAANGASAPAAPGAGAKDESYYRAEAQRLRDNLATAERQLADARASGDASRLATAQQARDSAQLVIENFREKAISAGADPAWVR